jgi:hypothetical protein
MKKIMFKDKFLLTQAVLEGRKTQTRRLIKCRKTFKGEWVARFNIHIRPSDKKVVGLPCMYDADESEFDGGEILPKYRVGEVVAVAQSYCSIADELENCNNATCAAHYEKNVQKASEYISWMEHPGFNNKMFVAADNMLHQIRITDVRVEKLQDISDEDCIKEGVELNTRQYEYDGTKYYCVRGLGYWRGFGCTNFHTPREAFAALIDKVSGKGTWERNPYVFVYDFELVK